MKEIIDEEWPIYAIDAAIEIIIANEPGLIPLLRNLRRTKKAIRKMQKSLVDYRELHEKVAKRVRYET